MPKLSDVKLTDGLMTLMKGEPGVRKSTCALSYPTPQYWFSTDMKMEALQLPAKKWGVDMSKIDFDDYNSWFKMEEKLKLFRVNCAYKTIIFDSITSLGDVMTGNVRAAKKSDGDKGKTIGGIQVSGLEEFNAESTAFKDMMMYSKDIAKYHKINVIIIAHVIGQRKDNEANQHTHHSRIIVSGAQQISAKIASYVTEAYHFNIEPAIDVDAEGKYALYTSHMGNDYARTSLPLPRKIAFNNDSLYEKFILPAIIKQEGDKGISKF